MVIKVIYLKNKESGTLSIQFEHAPKMFKKTRTEGTTFLQITKTYNTNCFSAAFASAHREFNLDGTHIS